MTEVRLSTMDITDLESLDLKTVSENGQRFYVDDKGDKYPSVTTVVGLESREQIKLWRKRVGEEKNKSDYKVSSYFTWNYHAPTCRRLFTQRKRFHRVR